MILHLKIRFKLFKYGCTALLESCLSGGTDSIELLMEYGADPEIEDADGVKPSTFSLLAGPQVTAVLEKWKRKRSGAAPALRENKSCDGCKESKTNLNVCSRCKVALYCSTTCQSTPLLQFKLFDGEILTEQP